jgi:hypothetical protein
MAKRTFMTQGLTFTAQAVSSALTNSTYMGIHCSTSTQIVDLLEVLISGMATASTVGGFQLSQVNTAAQTVTGLPAPHHDFFNNMAGTSLSSTPATFVSSATAPGATSVVGAYVLNLGLNLFGGIIRWNAAPTQQVTMVGAPTAGGQMILYNNSTQAGGSSGNANAHIIYEPY